MFCIRTSFPNRQDSLLPQSFFKRILFFYVIDKSFFPFDKSFFWLLHMRRSGDNYFFSSFFPFPRHLIDKCGLSACPDKRKHSSKLFSQLKRLHGFFIFFAFFYIPDVHIRSSHSLITFITLSAIQCALSDICQQYFTSSLLGSVSIIFRPLFTT